MSSDPRNKRRRASLYLEAAGLHVIVDTPPDFRDQVLTFKVPRMDALLYTHSHTDHIVGFDDIRRFNVVQDQVIPVYGSNATLADLTRIFPYVKNLPPPGLAYPRIELRPVSGPFRLGGIAVEPIPVDHAHIPTIGYRFEADGYSMAYVPDCHHMDDATIRHLSGVDVMILDALRPESHPTHYSYDESAAVLKRIGARQSFVTHMGHQLGHAEVQAALPAGITVPYDGLTIER